MRRLWTWSVLLALAAGPLHADTAESRLVRALDLALRPGEAGADRQVLLGRLNTELLGVLAEDPTGAAARALLEPMADGGGSMLQKVQARLAQGAGFARRLVRGLRRA